MFEMFEAFAGVEGERNFCNEDFMKKEKALLGGGVQGARTDFGKEGQRT
jgi:hypothetical protein